ncbi:MAG: hypothetical protein KDD66_14005 [Bdellovibrionales bacterium]|nr:hypothetical protein [Bdellovibrionales bacterium]
MSLVASCLLCETAWAQSEPGGFFSQDFVREGAFGKQRSARRQAPAAKPPRQQVEAERNVPSKSPDSEVGGFAIETYGDSEAAVISHSSDIVSKARGLSGARAQLRRQESVQKPVEKPTAEVVSMVVLAENRAHLAKSVRRFAQISQRYNVRLGELHIVAGSSTSPAAALTLLKDKELSENLADLSSRGLVIKPSLSVPQQYRLKASPAWIVRRGGRDYVYQGDVNPETFIAANSENRIGE